MIPSVQIELGSEDSDALAKEILKKRCENLTLKLTQAMSLPDPTIFQEDLPIVKLKQRIKCLESLVSYQDKAHLQKEQLMARLRRCENDK